MKGALVNTRPTAPDGEPVLSAAEVRRHVACYLGGNSGAYCSVARDHLLEALQTTLWAIAALKAAYLAARDELDDGECSAKMTHWIGADLKALGMDVEKL